MKIQLVNAYLNLMREDSAPKIFCGNDKDHMLPYANLDDKDNIYLYCFDCTWKMTIGLNSYDSMKEVLMIHDFEWKYFDEKNTSS